jgi:hypothetical protein
VFGEQEAVVIGVKPFDLHGVTYYDVTVLMPDRSLEQARLGTEGVPEGIQPGDHVMAMRVEVGEIQLREADDNLARSATLPPLPHGEYRLVREGPQGPHDGRFWVDGTT